ncbi:MAG: hypothetical protein AAFX85_02245 [Pseudomonadota bacterium]
MPEFDPATVRTLVGSLADGEHTLDLRGASRATALKAISQMLERHEPAGRTSVVILIDPATETSGETLFLPVGQKLLEARRRGLIARFHPLPDADGGGFYAELPSSDTAGRRSSPS